MKRDELLEHYGLCGQSLPRHVGIIMDGNGRWAQGRRRPRMFGHVEGAKALVDVATLAGDLKLEALTVYAFSMENWKRPKIEVDALMLLIRSYLKKKLALMHEENVRFHCIGNIDSLPSKVRDLVQYCMEDTAKNTGLTFSIALNYGGRGELCRVMQRISNECMSGSLAPEDVSQDLVTSYLDTAILPELDLLIRTGGEARLSNFLLWQLSYAEFYFSDLMWPDFKKDAFAEAIRSFQNRERRFGRTGAQVKGQKD